MSNEKSAMQLVGQKFNKLTVIERVENDIWGATQWLCCCNCGNERVVTGSSLTRSLVKSCKPCKVKLKRLPDGEAGFNRMWYDIRYNANQRGKEFSLTEEQVRNITGQNCHYCGGIPSQIKKPTRGNYTFYIANGIDRVDNDKGYHMDNVVPCCRPCNIAKGTMAYNEFKALIAKIYHNLKLH